MKKQIKYYGDPKNKIIGVSMGWTFKPQLTFEGGTCYYSSILDKQFHPEYFIDNGTWPIDPITKEKLPII